MNFLSKHFFQKSTDSALQLNFFRIMFCLTLMLPVILLRLPIGIFQPMPSLKWIGIVVNAPEPFFHLKISILMCLLFAAAGIWCRLFLMAGAFLIFLLVSNAYSFVYDPVSGYMPNDFNLPWETLLILSVSPGVTQMKIKIRNNLKFELTPTYSWPIHSVCLLIGVSYFAAFFSKMIIGSWSWFDGEILRGYLLEFGLFRSNASAIWLADQKVLTDLATLSVLLFESLALIGFLIPKTRLIFGIVGITFHILNYQFFGIDFLSKYLPVYLILVDWATFFDFIKKLNRNTQPAIGAQPKN